MGSYVRNSESAFTGLGELPTSLPEGSLSPDILAYMAKFEPDKYAAYLKQIDTAKIATKVSDWAIEQLKKDTKYGPVFAAALKGATNPKEVAVKAKAYADKMQNMAIGMSNMDKDALRMFYSQASAGLDLLDNYVSINPIARDVIKTAESGTGLFSDIKQTIGKFQKEGIDAGGVADAAHMVSQTFSFVNSIVQSTSKPGSKAAKVFGEITQWMGIAAGCTAAVTAANIAGAFGCAAAVMVKFFTMFTAEDFPKEVKYPMYDKIPMGVFNPEPAQISIIAADAIRLATVLKYRYKVKSWESILPPPAPKNSDGTWAKTSITQASAIQCPSSGGSSVFYSPFHPLNPMIDYYPKFDPWTSQNQLPFAWTPREFSGVVGKIVQGFYGVSNSPLNACPVTGNPIAWIGNSGWRQFKTGIKPQREAFWEYGDLDIDDVYWGAKLATDMGLHSISKNPVTLPDGKTIRDQGVDMQGDLIYSELVNYFQAVTVHQLNTEPKAIYPIVLGPLPVRYWYCMTPSNPERTWPTDPREPASKRYDSYVFTMKYPGVCSGLYGAPYQNGKNMRGAAAINWSHQGNSCAIREIGHIRLMAAASYIHMIYKWGIDPSLGKGEDMIAKLDDMSSNVPGFLMRMPVNPRSVFVGNNLVQPSVSQLKVLLQTLSKRMTYLQAKAKAQAEADRKGSVIAIDPKILAAFKAASISPSATSSSVLTDIMSGKIKMQSAYGARVECKKSGGAWFDSGATCDYGAGGALTNCRAYVSSDTGKVWRCVPSGTPGSVPITDEMLNQFWQPSKGPSIGTVLTIAGAGLLLMKLLKA